MLKNRHLNRKPSINRWVFLQNIFLLSHNQDIKYSFNFSRYGLFMSLFHFFSCMHVLSILTQFLQLAFNHQKTFNILRSLVKRISLTYWFLLTKKTKLTRKNVYQQSAFRDIQSSIHAWFQREIRFLAVVIYSLNKTSSRP